MDNTPTFTLLSKSELLNFPSASSIEYHDGKLYVIGDDARQLAILNKEYHLVDTVMLFPGDSLRIPKKSKTDLEASTIIRYHGRDHLVVAGSGSKPEREYILLFPIDSLGTYEKISTHAFIQRIKTTGIRRINFEGLAAVGNHLVFGNRGNFSNPHNQLIIIADTVITSQESGDLKIIDLSLGNEGLFKGVSGLAYIESLDMMLFTASTENTDNEIDDGVIGDSYLGYILNFSSKTNQAKVTPDVIWNLSDLHPDFRNEKIESVAIEQSGPEMILHLVADNDNGTSTLFKLKVKS